LTTKETEEGKFD